MSQAALGSLLGVDKDTIRSWEAGRSRPSMSRLELIAEKTETPIGDLLESEDEGPGAPLQPEAASSAARLGAIRLAIGRHPEFALLCVGALLAVAIVVLRSGQPTVRIYSSLPRLEAREPAETPGGGRGLDPVPTKRALTEELERAMALAVDEAGGRAGEFKVEYRPLDRSDATGESPDSRIEANARRAARDESTAVFIGDFSSGASRLSIPILSRAKVLQISPLATQVGLTKVDRQGGRREPGIYYAELPGYPRGYRNFVRIIPHDEIQARALLAVMTQSADCHRVAMINDNSSYGAALANNILASNHGRVRFDFSQAVGADARHDQLVDKVEAMRLKPDCFVYSGTVHPNTVEIFEDFGDELETAHFFGTDGLTSPSFVESLPERVAERTTLMVPPYSDSDAYRAFARAFIEKYKKTPSPQAVYAYEAMQLALQAIAESATGKPRGNALFYAERDAEDSVLGGYKIKRGDTTVTRYGVSGITNGKLTLPPDKAPPLRGPS